MTYFCPKTQSNMKACIVRMDDMSERLLPFASDIMKFYNVLRAELWPPRSTLLGITI